METDKYGDIKAKRRVSEATEGKEISYVKEEYGRMRNGEGQMRDVRGRVRIRQIDINERGAVESGYLSSSSLSDSRNGGGHSQREGSVSKTIDKEPGELSSESGSDDATDSEAPAKAKEVSKPDEPTKLDNDVQLPTGKKRKFSPIVWDRDDKDVSKKMSSGATSSAGLLPPPPPRPKNLQRTPIISSQNVVDIPPPPSKNLQQAPGISSRNVDIPPPPPKNLLQTPDISSQNVIDIPHPPLKNLQRTPGISSHNVVEVPPPPPKSQQTPDISSQNVVDIPRPPPKKLQRSPGISSHNFVDVPLPPPPPKSQQTPDILSHNVVGVPPPNLEYDKLHVSKSLPAKLLVELSKENGKSPTDVNMPSSPHHQIQLSIDPDAVHSEDDDLARTQKQRWSINHEAADEDFVPARNISSSRWADKEGSPRDVGEIADDLGPRKRRKQIPRSESYEGNFNGISSSPGKRKRGFDTEEDQRRSGPSSEDNFAVTESEKCNMTDSDVENDHSGSFSGNSDSGQDDLHGNQDAPAMHVRTVNMLQACRSVDEFERLNKIDEGTYGVVYRARDKKSGEIVALKKVKMEREREGFPLTSLREINILLSFHHPSIVDVKEVVVGTSLDSIFMVMEYMEHDLKGLMETMKQPYTQSEVKCLMIQLLEGVKYLHDNWVLHRDLKTSNLLLNNRGELKICDFGLSRQYGSPLKPYTLLVVTLWYRAPELLLGGKQYSTAIDMWSLGCIMAELLSKKPLFDGKTEFEQLDKIFRTLGTPSESIWSGFSKLPGVKVNFVKHQYNLLRKKFPATSFTGSPVLSDAGFDLLNKLLTYDPDKRITAEEALNHDWFREVPLPKSKDFMPTFPAQHAQDRRMRRVMKSPDPLEELRRKELQQGADLGTRGLFG